MGVQEATKQKVGHRVQGAGCRIYNVLFKYPVRQKYDRAIVESDTKLSPRLLPCQPRVTFSYISQFGGGGVFIA